MGQLKRLATARQMGQVVPKVPERFAAPRTRTEAPAPDPALSDPAPIRMTTRGGETSLTLDPSSLESYAIFLRAKSLPTYRLCGRELIVPTEYAARLGAPAPVTPPMLDYDPLPGLFDYQRDISRLALRRRKFAVFAMPGIGKTLIMLEFARHVAARLATGRCVLIVSPLMVVRQTLMEASRFYGDTLPIEQVKARDLGSWLESGTARIGITNYEALNPRIRPGRLASIIGDETSLMKSAYGKWGGEMIRLGRGLEWKLALTGTPAPNDRIEYANHAVFLDAFPNVNSFLARFFVNKGQTQERWIMKPHALRPFYRALSHWCIFLTNPGVYGWKDNAGGMPPIRVHVHDVEMTAAQSEIARSFTGNLIVTDLGGIASRSTLAQLSRGRYRGEDVATAKPAFVRDLAASWPGESALIWCRYNAEQDELARLMPDAANVAGSTPQDRREELIADFQEGRARTLISKPKLMGFGLNLQIATRQIFSGIDDSYESYYQAVKRSNRYGSTRPLDVHIPVTELERPLIENVLRKADRVEQDTLEQEAIFRESSL